VASVFEAPDTDCVVLFKEDYPRRIDRVISYFGDHPDRLDDPCGEALLELLSAERALSR
jgi:hypothetical protein